MNRRGNSSSPSYTLQSSALVRFQPQKHPEWRQGSETCIVRSISPMATRQNAMQSMVNSRDRGGVFLESFACGLICAGNMVARAHDNGLELSQDFFRGTILNVTSSKRSRRNPHQPGRRLNCFFHYRRAVDYMYSIRGEKLPQNELSKRAGEKWKIEKPAVTELFTDVAEAHKKVHEIQFPEYRQSLRSKKRNALRMECSRVPLETIPTTSAASAPHLILPPTTVPSYMLPMTAPNITQMADNCEC